MRVFTPRSSGAHPRIDTPAVRVGRVGDVYFNVCVGALTNDITPHNRWRVELHVEDDGTIAEARFVPDEHGFLAVLPSPHCRGRLLRCEKFVKTLKTMDPSFPFGTHMDADVESDGSVVVKIGRAR